MTMTVVAPEVAHTHTVAAASPTTSTDPKAMMAVNRIGVRKGRRWKLTWSFFMGGIIPMNAGIGLKLQVIIVSARPRPGWAVGVGGLGSRRRWIFPRRCSTAAPRKICVARGRIAKP
jgi:hypothetical protein